MQLLSNFPVDIRIEALLTRFFGFFDIQVTIKAGGPLPYSYCCLFTNIVKCILYIGGQIEFGIKILSFNFISFFIKDIHMYMADLYQYSVGHWHNV